MLKSLELQGFKSFAQKTVLEFPKGICAIVGPNGSGKSNIVDAIRWVLGEQSLKNLRSEKSEDVIFAGTPQKPATSLASVALRFDNAKKIFNLPYQEITIGRKLYRDGSSEYFLNRSAAKLKDIVQLLASVKLGLEGLAIINQGMADIFLKASAEERREMLEEMFGLKEHRLKKEEAERKIKETEQNLAEAGRLLEELEPHLRSLKRQASRWERRQEKEETLKALEQEFFSRKIAELEPFGEDIKKGKAALAKEISTLKEELRREESEFARLESALPQASEESQTLRLKLQQLEKERAETSRNIGKIEGQEEVLKTLSQRNNLSSVVLLKKLAEVKEGLQGLLLLESAVAIKESLKKVISAIEKFLARPQENEELVSSLRGAKADLAGNFERIDAEIQKASAEMARLAKIQEESAIKIRQAFAALEKKRNDLREKESLFREYELDEEKRHLREEDLRAKMREAGWDYDELASEPRPETAFREESPAELETKIFRLRRELADIGQVDKEILKEYEETSGRVEFIKNQRADLEKALKDLKSLSEELEFKIRSDFDRGLATIAEAFNHYFKLIFGGGSARIFQRKPKAFSNQNGEEGVPGGGKEILPEIEIDISLPRKKIRGLEMLSGGERALTAIAVIFAIVGSFSPPFLVLDEVDAALDETNSGRFANLLKELALKTQFLVITHNRATMESAEVLYGVTIEDGVSKIFSLKFEEAEKVARHDVHTVAT